MATSIRQQSWTECSESMHLAELFTCFYGKTESRWDFDVCLKKDAKQCSDATLLDCIRCAGQRLVIDQQSGYCWDFWHHRIVWHLFCRQTSIKISRDVFTWLQTTKSIWFPFYFLVPTPVGILWHPAGVFLFSHCLALINVLSSDKECFWRSGEGSSIAL